MKKDIEEHLLSNDKPTNLKKNKKSSVKNNLTVKINKKNLILNNSEEL